MASKPGILTDWPWKPLGSFKYVLVAPSIVHSLYCMVVKDKNERDIFNILIFPFLLCRVLHNHIWIILSRYRNNNSTDRIVDKGIEFEQIDRERNWDDQILLNGLLLYLLNYTLSGASRIPLWRIDGVVMAMLLHMGPVEFLYYWLHRALHHHFLYTRYHSHHHSSIVTQPITAVIHPFAELMSYFMVFLIPILTIMLTKTSSIIGVFGYMIYLDFMNNLGHCNFDIIPTWLFKLLPPLKYFMYTPRFHSLHHTQFRTNYSLFMPFYDYIYGTLDKASDQSHDSTSKQEEETPDVVHLTHFTTLDSIYHHRLGFSYLASKPYTQKWYFCLMWPVTAFFMILTWAFGRTFNVEENRFHKLKFQTWAIPKYSFQYFLQSQKMAINKMIEEAILDADKNGVKVLSLGLMNQAEELNIYGGLYVRKHPKLKVKIVDGSSLAVAVVLNSIPKGTTQVLLRGKLTKVAYALASALCQQGIKVATMHEDDYVRLKKNFNSSETNLITAKSYTQMTWLVGDELTKEEQLKAPKGTFFIPYSEFPPVKYRKDCNYHSTPAMLIPNCIENVHACENWLPRKVMSAWRIAGIVHCLEGWSEDECNYTMHNIDQVWHSALKHGFQPLSVPIKELAHD